MPRESRGKGARAETGVRKGCRQRATPARPERDDAHLMPERCERLGAAGDVRSEGGSVGGRERIGEDEHAHPRSMGDPVRG